MSQKGTVLIVDDHPLFREGLKGLLVNDSGFKVIGEARNGSDGLKKAKQLKPDLVIMDLALPGESGLEITRKMLSLLSETRIVVLSMHSKVNYIIEAFRAGAMGYVVKESAGERLIECLEAVIKGNYFLDTCLSREVVQGLMALGGSEAKVTDTIYSTLTTREQEIIRPLAEGVSTKEIAKRLCISPKTVENHRASIMGKLDLHSSMELVRYAARLGLIDVDLWKG